MKYRNKMDIPRGFELITEVPSDGNCFFIQFAAF